MNARNVLFVALIAAVLTFTGCKKCSKKRCRLEKASIEVTETVSGSRSIDLEKEELTV
jgi:hypothetical protein